jgi:hypothetical protein
MLEKTTFDKYGIETEYTACRCSLTSIKSFVSVLKLINCSRVRYYGWRCAPLTDVSVSEEVRSLITSKGEPMTSNSPADPLGLQRAAMRKRIDPAHRC